jgi:hypothetical protein
MLAVAIHHRDQGLSLRDIAGRLVITTGTAWPALVVHTEDGDVAVAPSATPGGLALPLPGVLHLLRSGLPRPVPSTARTRAPGSRLAAETHWNEGGR